MQSNTSIKQRLVNILIAELDKKIEPIQNLISVTKESRDNETKSTVGDKYETGRAMAQFEIQKNEIQLNKLIKQKEELNKLDLKAKNKKVSFGSLVYTNSGVYFMSIGLGKIECDNTSYYAISMVSPIGKLLAGKTSGDSFIFNGREFQIENVN